ncbi:hypothetical protein [Streptomyces sp. NBC_00083]|uniref:hypothetical protein n=1 Tax=Streptomyces sp. NBC_00083 TaxID=2975647 RepID=UPI002253F9FA|nr:hypothetical protein [Streptomyces sp. NBC_00083]MCX5386618.1 hypothetical protein [Streptomyces sp. NBC_00083]
MNPRFLTSAIDTVAAQAADGALAAPRVAACVPTSPTDGEQLVIPTRLVVIVVVIICFVGGFAALLRGGYTPTDTVSVLYLAGGVAVDIARRAIALLRRR